MPRLLAATDKFRGTLSAPDACAAIARAAAAAGWEPTVLPLADGGEGTLDALGGPNRTSVVTGPAGRPVRARWHCAQGTAVIEMAQAAGLVLAGGAEANDPWAATTRGVGELVLLALGEGARSIVVGVGGSATTDGGLGAYEVLAPHADRLRAVEVRVASDVTTGFLDAARVYGSQKGADAGLVDALTGRLAGLAERYLADHAVDVRLLPGSGAAGGLAGGLAALGARIVPGFALVAGQVGLDQALRTADLVVTGEGRLDATSLAGKVVGGVLDRAAVAGVRVAVVCGARQAGLGLEVPVLCLSESYGVRASMDDTAACVAAAVSDLLRGI